MSSWIVFSTISGTCYTISNIIARKVLSKSDDAWAYSFWFSFFGMIVTLPLAVLEPKFPSVQSNFWVYAVVTAMGLGIVGHNWLVFEATKRISASMVGIISKFRLLWALILGALWGLELLTYSKVLGVVAVVLSGALVFQGQKHKQSVLGNSLILISTILYATISLVIKWLLAHTDFSAASLTFGALFLGPTIINAALMPD